MKLIFSSLLFVLTLPAMAVEAPIKKSGNADMDTALDRLYSLYTLEKCTAVEESYEYIAPLMTKALREEPAMATYLKNLPLGGAVSDMHLKNLYEYQVERRIAQNRLEGKEGDLPAVEQLEALNKSVFRRIVPGEELPRDLLTFTVEQEDDGFIKAEVRWLSNHEVEVEEDGKMVMQWQMRKRSFLPIFFRAKANGDYAIEIIDAPRGEALYLDLTKKIIEEGKPAQWVLDGGSFGTPEGQINMVFSDYFTGFCDEVAAGPALH